MGTRQNKEVVESPPETTTLPSQPDVSTSSSITSSFFSMGEAGVGKTSLIKRWTEGKWTEPVSTEEIDFTHHSLLVEGKQVGLQIWDCPGGERNHVPGSYYHGALAVVGMYDVGNEDSLLALRKWFEDAGRYAGSNVTKVLVGTTLISEINCTDKKGNKTDGKKVVSSETAKSMAKEWGVGANLVFEVSVKDGTKVPAVFQELAGHVTKAVKTV